MRVFLLTAFLDEKLNIDQFRDCSALHFPSFLEENLYLSGTAVSHHLKERFWKIVEHSDALSIIAGNQ